MLLQQSKDRFLDWYVKRSVCLQETRKRLKFKYSLEKKEKEKQK